ncbi:P-loop containing nucleoside triphosphate hydrolases superfamily protein [Perilla frutescens var. hirtella]|nr:P-loop containing nucleoside triphosphate hydrolases superfamily protein [Perilla frutescens var. hirtella]
MHSVWEMRSVAGNVFSAYASVAASVMLFRSMANDVVPEPVKSFFHSLLSRFFEQFMGRFFARAATEMTMVVDEQSGIARNQIYDAAEVYLRTRINPAAERLKANKSPKQKSITLSMVKDQAVDDSFNGIDLKWQFVLVEADGQHGGFRPEKRWFELTFERSKKEAVVDEYLPFVLTKAQEIRDNDRAVKLYTRDCPFDYDDDDGANGGGGGGYWGCVNLDHPATFDKLAMDPGLKRAVIEDLDRFVRRKDYYKKVGKAWKRGYLLYGPPGTGKSSLVAAMANYLKFNVYDLELTNLYSNSELRRILLCTTNKSIIVIEDIDCSLQLHDRDRETESDPADNQSNTKLTLSGLLNFIDGLWSTCGDERIIIFTTNHKEKLDPALLRPGRMDMHIHMGYCTPEGFDVLALNYLGIRDHPMMFPTIKAMIRQVEITPAEIAEHLMRSDDVELALQGVVDLLEEKKGQKNGKNEEIVEGESVGGGKEKGKKGNFWKSVKNIKFARQLGKETKT